MCILGGINILLLAGVSVVSHSANQTCFLNRILSTVAATEHKSYRVWNVMLFPRRKVFIDLYPIIESKIYVQVTP
jgi:hypothetical protein